MVFDDLLIESQINMLLESPLEMPEDADLTAQLELLTARIEAAKKALGITNRIRNADDRKRHRGRVMTFMNQLRGMFDKVIKQMWEEYNNDPADAATPQPNDSVGATDRLAA